MTIERASQSTPTLSLQGGGRRGDALASLARIPPAGQRSRFTLNLKLLAGRGVGTLLIFSS